MVQQSAEVSLFKLFTAGLAQGLTLDQILIEAIDQGLTLDALFTVGVKLQNDHRFDSFGRWRTSEQQTIAELKLLSDKQPIYWAEKITNASGNATSVHSDASVTMHVESGDTIIRQTRQRWNYQPGKSQLCTYTGILGLQPAGITTRIGSFDANNGVFFESSSGEIAIVIRKSGADTRIPQDEWDADRLDGSADPVTNPSGILLDADTVQIFGVDYQWLGTGQVRFTLDIDGEIRVIHRALHANRIVGPYMDSPNLPVRYEISSTGPTAELLQICASIASEGGQENIGSVFSAEGGTVAVNAGVATALLGIRLRAANIDSAVRQVQKAGVAITQNDNFALYTLLNPDVANAFVYADYQSSAVQVAVGVAANTVSGGTRVGDTVFGGNRSSSAQSDVVNAIALGTDVDDVPDEIVLVVEPLQNGSYRGATAWQEAL